MCLDARLLLHNLVNMNINPNDTVFQHFKPNFYRVKYHMWGAHVSDTIFLTIAWSLHAGCWYIIIWGKGRGECSGTVWIFILEIRI